MKCSEISTILESLRPLCGFQGRDLPRALTDLQKLLSSSSDTTVAQFAKNLDKLKVSAPASPSGEIGEIVAFSEILAAFLERAGKTPLLKDVRLLASSLKSHKLLNADELVAAIGAASSPARRQIPGPPKADIVLAHFRLLEQSLGDDAGFTSAFRALEGDPNVGTPELVALAKQFSFAAVKSKAAALKKIWARHQALMTSRAKAAATAGRIAG